MSIITWIVLGTVSGFIASRLVGDSHQGFLFDMVLGVFGAVGGGMVFNYVAKQGSTSLNIWSVLVSILSAALVLLVYHAITRRRLHA